MIKIKEIGTDILLKSIEETISNNEETILLVSPRTNVVYNGEKEFNEEYCEKNKIPVYRLGYKEGGTIITTDKDLGIVAIMKEDHTEEILKIVFQWIEKNFGNVKINDVFQEHNDILVEGYKVVGSGKSIKGEFIISLFQVSFEVNFDLINNITKKQICKTPEGLSKFGEATRDDLIEEMKRWANGTL